MGHALTEEEIRLRCGQTPLGLRLKDVIAGLTDLPVQVDLFENWGSDDLRDELRAGRYPVVGVSLRPLDGRFAFHAVVIIKIEATKIIVYDPEPGKGLRELSSQSFLMAWEAAGRQVLILSSKA